MFEVGSATVSEKPANPSAGKDSTYARTLENSDVGDITKLSFVFDQEMRCWMPGSSNMLFGGLATPEQAQG
jgi:hypothetical protein